MSTNETTLLDVSIGKYLNLKIGESRYLGEILCQRKHPLLRGSGEFDVRVEGDFKRAELVFVLDVPYDGYQGEVSYPIRGEGIVAVRISESAILPCSFQC
jgi:hypothetical protein